jgi:protein-tyrosine phosphatase
MGNICRSPMAERLVAHAVRERLGEHADEWFVSESAGTGGWHAGEDMNPPASRELGRRGVSLDGFRARKLLASHIDTADLVLTATGEQLEFVESLRPDASARSFVLGQFGRLARDVDATSLPAFEETAEAVHARAIALVSAVDAARDGTAPLPGDELDDPWGRGETVFRGTADQITDSVESFVDVLIPKRS